MNFKYKVALWFVAIAVLLVTAAIVSFKFGESERSPRHSRYYTYESGRATAHDEMGSFHVDFDRNAIYPERYDWVGNYSYDRAIAKRAGKWFHIGLDGKPAYPERYDRVLPYSQWNVTVYTTDDERIVVDLPASALVLVRKKGDVLSHHLINSWIYIGLDGKRAYPEQYGYLTPKEQAEVLVKDGYRTKHGYQWEKPR